MPESTERNLPVWRRDRGWSSPLTYAQPDNIAVSTSGNGSVDFGSNGAAFSAGGTTGNHAQMDAYGLRGGGDINSSWL